MLHSSKSTDEWYRNNADAFVAATFKLDVSRIRERFTAMLPAQGAVLDLGSGSGRDSQALLQGGFDVTAVDPSIDMCHATADRIGYERVVCCRAQDIKWKGTFDGIWCMSSLVHVPRAEMEATFQKLTEALKPGGVLYVCFQKGVAEAIENGRHYTDYTPERLGALVAAAPPLVVRAMWETVDVLRPERVWLNCLAQRASFALESQLDGQNRATAG